MFLKVLTSFAVLTEARLLEVRQHAQVSSDGVVSLAKQQAGYWRASKAAMSALSAKAMAAQDSMDAKVTQMITTQQSADESCHSSLYRSP
mmetsp:Transcript_14937/g.37858  ORF Transcript_14937/g.37858 Transcript_14937/m.37858 type:complete len:90 (+) Transcript_14937:65-334(+)